MRRRLVASVLGLTCSFAVSDALAASEARCIEMGAKCICSEPLNTDTYTMVPGISWAWNPSDTGTNDKECNTSGQAGAFVEIDDFPGRFTTAAGGAPLAALPAGHTTTHVLRLKDGAGGMFAGVKFNRGEPHARRGFRYYKYYSADYSFTSDVPLCNSSKWGQMGYRGAGTGGPLMTEEWSFYDIEQSTGWNQNANGCCSGPGPGSVGTGPNGSGVKGKWIRFEFYMNNTNTDGTPTTFEAYLKNVTDNTPEIKIVDSSSPQNYANGLHWTTDLATTLHPTQPITDMSINMFRSNNGQACVGFAAFSHFLAAAWDTNSGQRIGAAREIEGGSATANPDAGTNPDGGGDNAPDGSAKDGCSCALGDSPSGLPSLALVGLSIAIARTRRSSHRLRGMKRT